MYNPNKYFTKKTEVTNDVKVEYDPSVISKKGDNNKDNGLLGRQSDLSSLALSSSMSKDDRLLRVKVLLTKGDVSVTQLRQDVNVSEATMLKYLKEIGATVVDGVAKQQKLK